MFWPSPALDRRVLGSPSIRAALVAALAASAALAPVAGPAAAGEMNRARFAQIMDATFGRGAWRMTGGYRTPERENELRAQGAMTVRPGGLSRHSLGDVDAPGAFDLVVDGMSPFEAADRLRAAGAPFARYQPKGAHGSQGPHLHLEPHGADAPLGGAVRLAVLTTPVVASSAEPAKPAKADADVRMRPVTLVLPALGAQGSAALRQQLARLRAGAEQDRADAQLELGRAYAFGYLAPRDFALARTWLLAAARNPDADWQTRDAAETELAEVTRLLDAERAQQAPTRIGQLAYGAAGR